MLVDQTEYMDPSPWFVTSVMVFRMLVIDPLLLPPTHVHDSLIVCGAALDPLQPMYSIRHGPMKKSNIAFTAPQAFPTHLWALTVDFGDWPTNHWAWTPFTSSLDPTALRPLTPEPRSEHDQHHATRRAYPPSNQLRRIPFLETDMLHF